MSASSASSRPAAAPHGFPAPEPLRPLAGVPVEAGGAAFAWTPVPAADAYRLQIAADHAFETLRLDLPVGTATEVTVFGQLPEDGRAWFWRVRAGSGPWSAAVRFHATGADAVIAYHAAVRKAAGGTMPGRRDTAPASMPAPLPPYRVGTTSLGGAVTLAAFALCGVLLCSLIVVLGGSV